MQGIYRKLILALLLYLPLQANLDSTSPYIPEQIIYTYRQHGILEALNLYEEHIQANGKDDYALLQTLALSFLEQCGHHNKPEVLYLLSYCASLTQNPKFLPILEANLSHENPYVQLSALIALGNFYDRRASELILESAKSPYGLIQLQGLQLLSHHHHPLTESFLETLLYKVPEEMVTIFPSILAPLDTPQANKQLKHLLSHSNEDVRIHAIHEIIHQHRDDFLPDIKNMMHHHLSKQKETLAFALAAFQDTSLISLLEKQESSSIDYLSLAASYALYELGHIKHIHPILHLASQGNPYALSLLSTIPEGKKTLRTHLYSKDASIQLTAIESMLSLKESVDLDLVISTLYPPVNTGYLYHFSPGGCMRYLKLVTYTKKQLKKQPYLPELSDLIREDLLKKVASIDENYFLSLAEHILKSSDFFLATKTIQILENYSSPQSIELLKKFEQKAGDPEVRISCCLALYRIGEKGPWLDTLKKWMQTYHLPKTLVNLQPTSQKKSSSYDLKPDTCTQIYIDIFETLATAHTDESITLLLKTFKTAPLENQILIAALLVKATA